MVVAVGIGIVVVDGGGIVGIVVVVDDGSVGG